MKHEEFDDAALGALQAMIDRSTATAKPAAADSVGSKARQMSAVELLEFWRGVKLVAMTTVGSGGRPHSAPVHARLAGTTLTLVIYDNTVRRKDLESNPNVSFVSWDDSGAAVILYGRAREVPGSLREARPSFSGNPRKVVEIEVTLDRIYAMSPRPRGGG